MALVMETGKDRFAQIRSAALQAFYKKGYHGTSLREIARDVGIKVPSLYNHMSSKQELLFRVLSSVMDELIAQTRLALSTCGEAPDERLRAAIRAFVLFNINHPHEAAVSDAEFKALTPDNLKEIIRVRDEFEAIYTELIQDGIDRGVFSVPDVRVIKNTILSACARVYYWYRPGGPRGPDEVADLITEHLIGASLIHDRVDRPSVAGRGKEHPE